MGDVTREPIGPEVKFVNIHEKVKWKGIKLVGGYGDTGTSFNQDGSVLPVQVIFQGKTERYLPAKSIRDLYSDWNFTYSENHWSNLGSMKLFINEVVRPYH